MRMKDHLFVCGTLLPPRVPEEIAHIVERLRSVGAATVGGRLYDLGDYPGGIPDANARETICGHVFELPPDEAVLKSLDEYEGYRPGDSHNLFVRERVTVTLEGDRPLSCWMYIYNRDPGDAPLVPGGDYAKMKADRQGAEIQAT
jgi:gamma-glutamylcyclotransferase (GGCT)/AIG2-like uncharacterized protein YtfP